MYKLYVKHDHIYVSTAYGSIYYTGVIISTIMVTIIAFSVHVTNASQLIVKY